MLPKIDEHRPASLRNMARRGNPGVYNRKSPVLEEASSGESTEDSGNYRRRPKAEDLDEYGPSQLVHGNLRSPAARDMVKAMVSDSSSEEEEQVSASASEDSSASADSENSEAERSIKYVESDGDELEGVLQMGCMDGLFMPRKQVTKNAIVRLNEKGEKELKFNMKLPIAMGFQKNLEKEQKKHRSKKGKPDPDDDDDDDDDEDDDTMTLASMIACQGPQTQRALCRGQQNVPDEALDAFNIPRFRFSSEDPPASVASDLIKPGRKDAPTEPFKSLMSLSIDGSMSSGSASGSGDESSNNRKAETSVLPRHMQPMYGQMPSHMHGQMMYGQGVAHQWQQQTMMYPHPPSVTVNNTYEMLVVNGMPSNNHPLAYNPNQTPTQWPQRNPHFHPDYQPLEPPGIERLPSQIVVQQEEETFGEESSFVSSYDVSSPHCHVPTPKSWNQQHNRVQPRIPPGPRVLQSTHHHPHVNTSSMPYQAQNRMGVNTLAKYNNTGKPLASSKSPLHSHTSANQKNQKKIQNYVENKSTQIEKSAVKPIDEFLEACPENAVNDPTPRVVRNSSSSSSGGSKPHKLQRWRQANIQRLQQTQPALQNTEAASKPSAVPSTLSGASKNQGGPSFDEGPKDELEKSKKDDGFVEDDNNSVGSDQAIMFPSEEPKGTGNKKNLTKDESKSSPTKILSPSSQSSERTKVTHNGILQSSSTNKSAMKTSGSSSENSEDKDKGTAEETSEGLFLSFDKLYTRRRQRLDAWKKMMYPSSQSNTDDAKDDLENRNDRKGMPNLKINTGQQNSNPITQIASVLFPGNPKTNATENHQPKFPNEAVATSSLDGDIPPIKMNSIKESSVLQPVLDAPGMNKQNSLSPRKVSVTEDIPKENKVSKIPLSSPHASFSVPAFRESQEDTIKMSLSIKPTMTSEFHDAMSTNSESPRHTIRSNHSLRIQPTFTSEWHDTIQSPTSVGSTAAASVIVKSPLKKTPFIIQQNSSILSDEDGSQPHRLAANSRSSDHDEFFEAQMLVD